MGELFPDRPDWEQYRTAMHTIAAAFGTHVRCHQKYDYLAIDFNSVGLTIEQVHALNVVEELVALVSEFPPGYLQTLDPLDPPEMNRGGI